MELETEGERKSRDQQDKGAENGGSFLPDSEGTGSDPLREKLVREEMGGAAPADTGPAAEEAGHQDEDAARRNVRKAEFITRVLLGGLSLAMKEVAKVRGDHWKLSNEEKQEVGDSLFPVTMKYVEEVWVPVWLDRYQEEMGLAWALIVILYAKMEIDEKTVEAQAEKAAADEAANVQS